MEVTYTVSELKQLLKEASSRNEFKPKMGDGVEGKNKEINDKAYKDAEEISKEHYGKKLEAPKMAKYEKHDGNRTMLSHEPDFEPGDEWKKSRRDMANGYNSTAEKNNGIEKSGDYDKNAEVYDAIEKTDLDIQNNKEVFRGTGIQGQALAKSSPKYLQRPNMYVKGKKVNEVKTVYFKKTQFITEGHMISKIPDEFKNEGTTFRMKDKTGNEYLIEWSDNRPVILEHEDKVKFNESLNKMKSLMGYDSKTYYETSSASQRLNESNEGFTKTLNNIRNISK